MTTSSVLIICGIVVISHFSIIFFKLLGFVEFFIFFFQKQKMKKLMPKA